MYQTIAIAKNVVGYFVIDTSFLGNIFILMTHRVHFVHLSNCLEVKIPPFSKLACKEFFSFLHSTQYFSTKLDESGMLMKNLSAMAISNLLLTGLILLSVALLLAYFRRRCATYSEIENTVSGQKRRLASLTWKHLMLLLILLGISVAVSTIMHQRRDFMGHGIKLNIFAPSAGSHYCNRRERRHHCRMVHVCTRKTTEKSCKHLLLLLCGDVHPNPGPALAGSRRHPDAHVLNVASWNVRTLLETKRRAERPSAVIARELSRYDIDIAALSETRISGETILEEVGGGYTFFLIGRPEGFKREYGVGFAIKSKLVGCLNGKYPKGINERLMSMELPLTGCTLTLISAYAPTLQSSAEMKGIFYDQLNDTLNAVPFAHKLLLLGDFNARVGNDHINWSKVIGQHGVGIENSNGTLLLSTCAEHELIITNTMFQQDNMYKTSWMHPRTKEWHMIDYVITRQRDMKDIHLTRVKRGTCTWSDHRLVKSKVALRVKVPRQRRRTVAHKKLDVEKLKSQEVREELTRKLEEAFKAEASIDSNLQSNWDSFKTATMNVSEEVLGIPKRKHRDWFDENDPEIQPLLNQLHDLHLDWQGERTNEEKHTAYKTCKQQVQRSLRIMQDTWWKERADELQTAADTHDMKTFFKGLDAIYGPKIKTAATIKSKDGILLTEPSSILERWAEHFDTVLNQNSTFDMTLLDEIPQWDVNEELNAPPNLGEIRKCIKQLSCGKAPGEDGIPPEVYKHGGECIAARLLDLYSYMWEAQSVVQDFKDVSLVHIYKRKGDRLCCDNHRGISLLSIAGKILARILLNRLILHTETIGVIPESQCGFRSGRGTMDMIFSLRQIQEKCKLQHQELYLLFIDLTKAFDTVSREGLWLLLGKIGCPNHFVSIIRSFHDGMQALVREGGERSPLFNVTSGTKQGCVLSPTLFSIFFSLMLRVAFKDSDDGIDLVFRTDKNVFSSNNRFSAVSKVSYSTLRDFLFADDCALAATSEEALQRLCNCFSTAASRFGLTISIKKTETLYQPSMHTSYVPPVININNEPLKAVDNFGYLGSITSRDGTLNSEITSRIAKATTAFGRLTKRLWKNRNVRLSTKIAVYKAAVIPTLLYACEAWAPKKEHIRQLERFHQKSLRRITRIRWFHKITNVNVLYKCNITSIEAMLDKARLRWAGHLVRMDDSRIPKMLLYGKLRNGQSRKGNHLTYVNKLKGTMRACKIDTTSFEVLAKNRSQWRAVCKAGAQTAENERMQKLTERRELRKAREALSHDAFIVS